MCLSLTRWTMAHLTMSCPISRIPWKTKSAKTVYGKPESPSQIKPIFSDTVIKSQFYYVDRFLVSASSNNILVHRLSSLDSIQDCSYSLAKLTKLDCHSIADVSAVNGFHSNLVLAACSDRALRVLDANASLRACREIRDLHRSAITALVQPRGCGGSERDFDLFATAAVGEQEGIKVWDLRQTDPALMLRQRCDY